MQRSVDSADGTIYFQVVNATLQRDGGGQLSGITQSASGPATTLYAVDPVSIVSVLNAAGASNTLVGLAGVTKVRDFSRAELGITNEQTESSKIALLSGFLTADQWDAGLTGAQTVYASVTDVPFSAQPEQAFLGRLSGPQLTAAPLAAIGSDLNDSYADPQVGLFVRAGTGASSDLAYHFNPATGVLSQISLPLYQTISSVDANGQPIGVPADVTFTPGTDTGDTLGSSAATGRQWIAGGTGDDLLQGGSAHDNLYGGAGSDTLIGAGGHDVLTASESRGYCIASLRQAAAASAAGRASPSWTMGPASPPMCGDRPLSRS
jgi:Ca2+-binding RTX toxin-like protein